MHELHYSCSSLWHQMTACGQVTIMTRRDTGTGRGHGHVNTLMSATIMHSLCMGICTSYFDYIAIGRLINENLLVDWRFQLRKWQLKAMRQCKDEVIIFRLDKLCHVRACHLSQCHTVTPSLSRSHSQHEDSEQWSVLNTNIRSSLFSLHAWVIGIYLHSAEFCSPHVSRVTWPSAARGCTQCCVVLTHLSPYQQPARGTSHLSDTSHRHCKYLDPDSIY